jgi:hypothetical protein
MASAAAAGASFKTSRRDKDYFDDHQPIWYEFPLPGGTFTAEMIDPIAITISALPGTFSGKTKIRLSGRPFRAVG